MSIVRYGRFFLPAMMVAVLILPSAATEAQAPDPDASKGKEATEEPRLGEESAPGQIIVKYKDDAGARAQNAIRSQEGLEKKDGLDLINAEVLQVEDRSIEEAIDALESRPEVEYAERNYIFYPTSYTDEPRFGDLWGLDNTGQVVNGGEAGLRDVDVNAPEAAAITQGNKDLVVAVIDDGADFSHPDLAGRQWMNLGESGGGKENNGLDDDGNGFVDDVNGWDFVSQDNTVHDENRDLHGTHVSGTIAASANEKGVVGVAPNVKIMPLKFIGTRFGIPRSGGFTSDAIKAIEYAKKMGAKISNNSWGGSSYSQALKDAIGASDMLFVAAAGNSGTNSDTTPSYPASYDNPNILSVAAVDNRGNLASFSNYGSTSVDISAPGVSVLSSVPEMPDMPAVALSSVGASGKAVTAGFGVEEIGDETHRTSFMKKAFEAIELGSQPVVLVDDDASDSPFGFSNVRPTLRDDIQRATGGRAPDVINVPYGGTPAPIIPSDLSGKTVVWATGQTPVSGVDLTTGEVIRNLTPTDRLNLTEFLNDGGKLVLTGRDALYRNENDSLVTSTLGLNVQRDLAGVRTFDGYSGTAFAGESYKLNSAFADSDLHDALAPAGSAAVTQGVYPGRSPWEFLNGTSMAAPHVTGAAALGASVNPALLGDLAALKEAVMDGGKPAPATDGKTVTSDIVDARGTLSHADANPPEAPVITSPKNDSYDNDGNFTVSGIAEKGGIVELFELISEGDEQSKDQATADRLTGEWSVELTDVAEGPHTYTAKATDAVGNTSVEAAALKVTVDKTALKVEGFRPQNGTKGVSRSVEPTVTFFEDVDSATLNNSTIKIVNTATGRQARAEVSCENPCRKVTINPYPSDPSKQLAKNTRYKITITTGAKDLAGNTLAKKVVWSFTTDSR